MANDKYSEDEYLEKINKLDRFPGSLSEYNELKGRKHEVIDTGRSRKDVDITKVFEDVEETNLAKRLIDGGCTGFIRYVRNQGHLIELPSGLPVRPI